jgi:hypothetical protein
VLLSAVAEVTVASVRLRLVAAVDTFVGADRLGGILNVLFVIQLLRWLLL